MKRINLSELPKQDPFLKPAGYLENLPQRVQQRITTKPRGIWSDMGSLLVSPRLQLAFTLTVLLIASLFFFRQEQTTEYPAAYVILNNTTEQEIVNYLSSTSGMSIEDLSEGNLDGDIYAVELGGEAVLEDEIILNIDSYSSEELWK